MRDGSYKVAGIDFAQWINYQSEVRGGAENLDRSAVMGDFYEKLKDRVGGRPMFEGQMRKDAQFRLLAEGYCKATLELASEKLAEAQQEFSNAKTEKKKAEDALKTSEHVKKEADRKVREADSKLKEAKRLTGSAENNKYTAQTEIDVMRILFAQ